jgi:putative membrane protein
MRATTVVIAFTLAPIVANAQIGNPAFMAPDTQFDRPGVPAPNQPNTTDKIFAQLVSEGGMAEVELGRLVVDKAQTSAVGDFARMMIDDHSMANDKLAATARRAGVPLMEELSPEHQGKRAQLETLDGSAFELEYMRSQVVDHQKTTQLLIWEIGSGQDANLQQFAKETLPTVLEHLKMARAIVDELVSTQVAATR